MDTVVVGIIAVLIGALLCFCGYATMRLIISLFGAFVGFLLGAGVVAGVTDSGFGQLALSWIVGVVAAVIFGVLAYLSYQVAIVIGMAAIGFTIGTSVMAASGVSSPLATVLVGVAVGVLLAVIAVATDLPAVILVVLTALAGASVTVSGLLLLTGSIGLNRVTAEGVGAAMARGWWWYVAYGALALLGIIAQLRARGTRTMRQQWGSSTPARAVTR